MSQKNLSGIKSARGCQGNTFHVLVVYVWQSMANSLSNPFSYGKQIYENYEIYKAMKFESNALTILLSLDNRELPRKIDSWSG